MFYGVDLFICINSMKFIQTTVQSRKLKIIFGLAIFLLTVAFLPFQNHVDIIGYAGFGGLFINDTLGMESNIHGFLEGLDVDYSSIYGVMILYFPSYYLGNVWNLILNFLLLIIANHFFIKTIDLINIKMNNNKIYVIYFIIISNIYILSCMYYPNKEIPLIAITNAFIYCLISDQKIYKLIFIIVLSYYIRDGYAFILSLTYAFTYIYKILKINSAFYILLIPTILFSFLSLEFIASLEILGQYDYAIQRNLFISKYLNSTISESIINKVPIYFGYPIKVINHIFGLALRPQYMDLNDRVYLAGIGLWQNGVIILMGVLAWLYLMKSNNNFLKIIGIFIVMGLLSISVGSFTQARYMMPYIFWLTLGFVFILDLNNIILCYLVLFLIAALLFFAGFGAPIPLGIDVHP